MYIYRKGDNLSYASRCIFTNDLFFTAFPNITVTNQLGFILSGKSFKTIIYICYHPILPNAQRCGLFLVDASL